MRGTPMTPNQRLLILVLILASCDPTAIAQTGGPPPNTPSHQIEAAGYDSRHAYSSAAPTESINLFTGGLQHSVRDVTVDNLAPYDGLLPLVTRHYSSKIYRQAGLTSCYGAIDALRIPEQELGLGWTLHFGRYYPWDDRLELPDGRQVVFLA